MASGRFPKFTACGVSVQPKVRKQNGSSPAKDGGEVVMKSLRFQMNISVQTPGMNQAKQNTPVLEEPYVHVSSP